MAKFATGDIIVVKVTGEQVLVKAFDEQTEKTVVVRGVQTKDSGVQYVTESFNGFELETTIEQIERELKKAEQDAEGYKRYKAIKAASTQEALPFPEVVQ